MVPGSAGARHRPLVPGTGLRYCCGARNSSSVRADELRLAQRHVVVGVELDVARVRRLARDERADLAQAGRVVAHRHARASAPPARRGAPSRRRAGGGSTPGRQRVGVRRRVPEAPDPVVGAERRPDLEVDLQHRLEVALRLRRLVARLLLLGVGGAVVAAETRGDERRAPALAPGARARRRARRAPPSERPASATRSSSSSSRSADDVVLPRPRRRRAGRAAEEAEVGADRPEPLGEERHDRLPQPRVAEPAVQEQHRLAASGLVVPEPRAVDLHRGHGATIASSRMDFEHVLVVGAGQMGGGIAQVVAASGRRVSLHDAAPGRGRARARDDAPQPDEARGEGRRRSGRGARAGRAGRTTSWPPT